MLEENTWYRVLEHTPPEHEDILVQLPDGSLDINWFRPPEKWNTDHPDFAVWWMKVKEVPE